MYPCRYEKINDLCDIGRYMFLPTTALQQSDNINPLGRTRRLTDRDELTRTEYGEHTHTGTTLFDPGT